MSFWLSQEAKKDFFKRAYGGAPLKEGESILDIVPINFQHGLKVMERPRSIGRNDFLRADFEKVELRVMSSLPELSDEDLELCRKMGPLIQEKMDFAIKQRLGLRPDAIDADFAIVDDPLLPEVRRG